MSTFPSYGILHIKSILLKVSKSFLFSFFILKSNNIAGRFELPSISLCYAETRMLLEDNNWDSLLEKDQGFSPREGSGINCG